ncbi:DUF3429 domain-containing protein [Herminiimonas sp. CN]|uniref:DUF3429 domain-containing protein n=1 Tax=Herminiimonas sp. CN TaxID=1349818 RepID=UPI000A8F99DC|nr:DUF3429 domain-containing protein [Herminiimonas sp. CN]
MNTHFLNKRFAHVLGFAGLIPFVLLMLASWTVHPDWIGVFMRGQLAYSIAILSFLGGIHWGGALVSDHLSIEQTKKYYCGAWCRRLFRCLPPQSVASALRC